MAEPLLLALHPIANDRMCGAKEVRLYICSCTQELVSCSVAKEDYQRTHFVTFTCAMIPHGVHHTSGCMHAVLWLQCGGPPMHAAAAIATLISLNLI